MEWIRVLFICVMLGRAVYTDVKQGIIENRCVVPGAVTGLFLSYMEYGFEGMLDCLKPMGMVLLVLFPLFLIKGLGAGDIKLFCALAVFYPEKIVWMIGVSFIVAAGWSVGNMVIRSVKRQQVYVKGETLNFSVPIACGVFIVYSVL